MALSSSKINSTTIVTISVTAVGVCEATEEYDADGPDQLSFQAGERIIILGLLVACFDWFMGKLERTGDIGLVKTNLVKTTSSFCE